MPDTSPAYPRTAQAQGRTYIVVPAVAIVAGTFNRANFTPAVIEEATERWRGTPLTREHPADGAGDPIPAAHKAAHKFLIGFADNPRYEDGKLKVELWLDTLNPQALPIIEMAMQKQNLDISIGAVLSVSGTDQDGNAEIADLRPDHIAILLDSAPACSQADGCGVWRFQATPRLWHIRAQSRCECQNCAGGVYNTHKQKTERTIMADDKQAAAPKQATPEAKPDPKEQAARPEQAPEAQPQKAQAPEVQPIPLAASHPAMVATLELADKAIAAKYDFPPAVLQSFSAETKILIALHLAGKTEQAPKPEAKPEPDKATHAALNGTPQTDRPLKLTTMTNWSKNQ